MELGMILIVGGIVFIMLAIGGGIGFWLWLATRTKKMIWKARVYQKADGEIQYLDQYMLHDLKPYTIDIIEKIDKKNGATHYWMQKMKKAVPVVTADCVEVWGEGKSNKEVRVLLDGDTCTLLKSGYDEKIGAMIFKPIPHDRINMIKTEQSERKERIQDKKDILASIAPFVTTGIWVIGLVIVTYIIIQGALKSAEANQLGSFEVSKSVNQLSNAMLTIYGYDPQSLNSTDDRKVTKENPPIPP